VSPTAAKVNGVPAGGAVRKRTLLAGPILQV
jgi:hypothetical protein